MSLLHSFYCWGQVGVVLLSTMFFTFFGIENWRILAVIWAVVPTVNAVIFAIVPLKTLVEDGDGMKLGHLLKSGLFRMLFIMMLCAGACEMADGNGACAVRKIRRQDKHRQSHARNGGAVRGGVFVHSACAERGHGAYRVRDMRLFGGDNVAGNVQQERFGTAERRHDDVRAAGSGG